MQENPYEAPNESRSERHLSPVVVTACAVGLCSLAFGLFMLISCIGPGSELIEDQGMSLELRDSIVAEMRVLFLLVAAPFVVSSLAFFVGLLFSR